MYKNVPKIVTIPSFAFLLHLSAIFVSIIMILHFNWELDIIRKISRIILISISHKLATKENLSNKQKIVKFIFSGLLAYKLCYPR